MIKRIVRCEILKLIFFFNGRKLNDLKNTNSNSRIFIKTKKHSPQAISPFTLVPKCLLFPFGRRLMPYDVTTSTHKKTKLSYITSYIHIYSEEYFRNVVSNYPTVPLIFSCNFFKRISYHCQ